MTLHLPLTGITANVHIVFCITSNLDLSNGLLFNISADIEQLKEYKHIYA